MEELRQIVLTANSTALNLLRCGKGKQAFHELKFAEAVLASNPSMATAERSLVAVTCSNFGCYYRRRGFHWTCLRYLQMAAKAEPAINSCDVAAIPTPDQVVADVATNNGTENGTENVTENGMDDEALTFNIEGVDICSVIKTKLNMCAALSGVGDHENAAALAAEIACVLASHLSPPVDLESSQEDQAVDDNNEELYGLFAVACHNLGAEREHLKRWGCAAVAYELGSNVASRILGPTSPMVKSLASCASEAYAKSSRNPTPPMWSPNVKTRAKSTGIGLLSSVLEENTSTSLLAMSCLYNIPENREACTKISQHPTPPIWFPTPKARGCASPPRPRAHSSKVLENTCCKRQGARRGRYFSEICEDALVVKGVGGEGGEENLETCKVNGVTFDDGADGMGDI